MQDKAFKNEKLEFIWDTSVEEILGTSDEGVNGVRLRNLKTGAESVFPCAGVFIAIGHKPNTELFKGQIDTDSVGYIKTSGHSTATNIPGVFACGDVQDHVYRLHGGTRRRTIPRSSTDRNADWRTSHNRRGARQREPPVITSERPS